MTVRKTESRLPAGFSANDLGQAVVSGKYALVSYLTSPIALGSTIDYVVFATEGAAADEYRWTFTLPPPADPFSKAKPTGMMEYKPPVLGMLRVTVEVWLGGSKAATLQLSQDIVPPEAGLERLFSDPELAANLATNRSVGALGGDKRPSRELVNDLRSYVFAAAMPPPPLADVGIPPTLIAAVTYQALSAVPRTSALPWQADRSAVLRDAADELNGDRLTSIGTQIDNALGACQISPQTLATVLTRPQSTTTYTPWRERSPTNGNGTSFDDAVLADFEKLPEVDRLDLYNLLRFPKTNVRMCAHLLVHLKNRAHRWPALVWKELLSRPQAMGIIATERDAGPSPAPAPTIPPVAGQVSPNKYGNKIVEVLSAPFLGIYFTSPSGAGLLEYGGFRLQLGDNDSGRLWEGKIGPPGVATHVRKLQEDLDELGFKLKKRVGAAPFDGVFDLATQWAVREFQIYARMPNVAVESASTTGRYIDRLKQQRNLLPYSGPVSGVVNPATSTLLQYWKAHRWRCPVVIGAWTPPATATAEFQGHNNIWLPLEVASTDPRMYARDFSGYYDFASPRPDALLAVGTYTATAEGNGPYSVPPSHALVEVRSTSLLGRTEANLANAAERSTFKVVRAVAEVECNGYYDSFNGYDSAILSIGLFHWTIGRPTHNDVLERDGELPGLLAYLRFINPASYHRVLGTFGTGVNREWVDSEGNWNGQELLKSERRKYSAWLTLQQETGPYAEVARSLDEANYFRTWHWFYRFEMAVRSDRGFQAAMWDYARIRLRDITSIPWGVPTVVAEQLNADGTVDDGTGGRRSATVGDVFTSEKAIALLLRVHVLNAVPRVLSNKRAGQALRFALRDAKVAQPGLSWESPPSTWTTPQETALSAALLPLLKAGFGEWHQTSIDNVANYPTWSAASNPRKFAMKPEDVDPANPALRTERNSFRFDDSALPPAPDYDA
jgi:peptidoglycan hydrolase-like protein with peptidoglycan-binding domain